ncbi:LCP family protein [Streptococcus pluranimalium]|uniref:LCP family protein n=1 Tax=Streptococcus pluranimalium TaxID=82348 RepID=UPI0039FCBBB5
MVKKHTEGLSHHEELRYQYLLKHSRYLSEREKAEFDYLYHKQQQINDQIETTYQDNLTAQGLPVFPEARQSSNHKPRYSRQHRRQQAISDKGRGHNKPKRSRVKRFFLTVMFLFLMLMAALFVMFFKGVTGSSKSNGEQLQPAVQEYFEGQDSRDGANILILGSDKRIAQGSEDARTDTIMVVNVGNKDKDVKMVSFMRDTLVNIPGLSSTDYLNDQKLNTAFNVGEQNNHQGAELMRETLKANFDIDIKYYMMVDFETFAEAIDALFPKGVSINAVFATVDGEDVDEVAVPDDLSMDEQGNVPDQIIRVGKQRMDGRTLLNYARFRKDDLGDYGRTQRQQQVLSEIMKQVKDPSKLFTGSEALGKIYALTSTNVSYPYLLKAGLTSLASGDFAIQKTTIPEQGDWIDEFDVYGGQGLAIDFDKYQEKLSDLGLR